MRRMITAVALSACIVSSAIAWAEPLPSAGPEQVGLSAERLDRIRQAFEAEISKGKLPGAVVLVARKGRVAYFEPLGLRDKVSGAPMSKDAIFRIYSMTKPLVSVAAMILMEDGKLVLTDPVSRHLPELAKLQAEDEAEALGSQGHGGARNEV